MNAWDKVEAVVCHAQSYHSYTGWQRPIGCLKLPVIFRKRATNYRALLRKITYKDKASYGSSPPCTCDAHNFRTSKRDSRMRARRSRQSCRGVIQVEEVVSHLSSTNWEYANESTRTQKHRHMHTQTYACCSKGAAYIYITYVYLYTYINRYVYIYIYICIYM